MAAGALLVGLTARRGEVVDSQGRLSFAGANARRGGVAGSPPRVAGPRRRIRRTFGIRRRPW